LTRSENVIISQKVFEGIGEREVKMQTRCRVSTQLLNTHIVFGL